MRWFSIVTAGYLTILSIGVGGADASRMDPTSDLSGYLESATYVVYGAAVSETTRTVEIQNGVFERDVVFQVKAVVKGADVEKTIVVIVPAWSTGGPRRLDAPALADVRLGRSYLLLLGVKEGQSHYRLAEKHGNTLDRAIPAATGLAPDELVGISPQVAAAKTLASCFQIGDATLAASALGTVNRETERQRKFLSDEAQQTLHDAVLLAMNQSAVTDDRHDYASFALCHLGDPHGAADAARILSDENHRLWSQGAEAIAALLDWPHEKSLCESCLRASLAGKGLRSPRLMESLAKNCPDSRLGDELVAMVANRFAPYCVAKILRNKWVQLTPEQTNRIRELAVVDLNEHNNQDAINLLRDLGDPKAIPDLEKARERIAGESFSVPDKQKLLLRAVDEALSGLKENVVK